MANNSSSVALLLICAAILLLAATSPPMAVAEGEHYQPRMAMKASSSCNGSIWECMGGEEEFEMDSETNRRMLASNDHIDYGALQRDTVPCSRKGATSGNCKPAAVANPYKRGCNPITGCRSG